MGAEDDLPRYHGHCAHGDDMNNLAVLKDPGALNDLGVVKGPGLLKVLFVSLVHFDH